MRTRCVEEHTKDTKNNSEGVTFSMYSGLVDFIFSMYNIANTKEHVETHAF